MVPALSVLDRVALWPFGAAPGTEGALTLEHLGLTLIVAVLTTALARNVPALLEMLLLRLPINPGSRAGDLRQRRLRPASARGAAGASRRHHHGRGRDGDGDPDSDPCDDEDRHRNHAGHDPRDDQELERIDRHRLEGVDLLGHLHRPELGPDPGPDPTRDEQPDDERSGLPHQREGQRGRNEGLRPEPLERRPRVHRHHDADRVAGRRDQRQRAPADLVDLPQRLPELERRPEHLAQRAPGEDHAVPPTRQPGHHDGAHEGGCYFVGRCLVGRRVRARSGGCTSKRTAL